MVIAIKQKGSREGLTVDKYFNLIEHAADGIAILQDGVFKLVNTALARISGYDKEELLGMPFTNLLTPESQKLTMKRYQARLAGKKVPPIYEIKAVTKDGEVRDIEINAALTEYEGRAADEIIVRNITERKKAEQLQHSENYVLTLLGQGAELSELLDAIVRLGEYHDPSIKGSVLLFDSSKEQLFQASAPSLPDDYKELLENGLPIGPNVGSCGTAAYLKERVIVTDIANNPLFKPFEEVVKRAVNNSLLAVWSQPIIASNGDLLGTIANYSNKVGEPSADNLRVLEWSARIAAIAIERKQAEETLRESREFSSSLLESSPNPTSVINPDTSVRYVNPAFEKLTGFTLAEITGRKAPYPWWPEEQRKEMTATLKNAMAHGGRRTERIFQKKNGERCWVAVNSAPVVYEGKPIYFLLNWLDITERKQAEEKLRESEEKFSKVFSSSANAISIHSLKDNKLIEVNESFTRFTGYTREEAIGHSTAELGLWVKEEELKRWINKLQEKGEAYNEEFHSRMKSGEIRVGLASAETLNIGGKPCRITMIADITERKQMEQQVQEKNEQLDAQNEELKAINEELQATEQQLQEKNEQLDAQNEELKAINEELQATEQQLQERNEELDAQNEELKAINEELQATEEELQQNQEKLERMFESVIDGIVVANLDGTILKVNEKAVQLHGFASEDELLGKKTFELIAPGDRKRKANNVRKALKEGSTRSQEYALLRADGSEFPGELSTSALKDASGNVIGHITIARDITERRQAEERERQLQQELDLTGRLASIGQMASGVAHEINNPLTGVIGFSHLMLSRDIPDDMKQDLKVINSEAQRVAKIVENLLTFAHQRKPGQEYVDINNIVASVLELRAYEMKVNNIEVETQLASDLPPTMADAGQLQQVFLNIVLNAEHFMTTAHNRGKLLVKTERIDDNIRASFTDDGAGISKEDLDKIFNPFFTTKEVGHGTGLGLSICHGIIAQHKGRIYAQSEWGQGATFVVELPIVDDSNQAGQAEVTKDELEKPEGAKILVVDDEPAILTFLRRLLTQWGHSVETINNADAALERLKSERYSLILLDIKLPGMSGVELYRHIEEIAPALTRRVMFITGDIMETATQDFLDRAKVPHITKPINIELLKKSVNHALNQTHAAATTPG
jgi:PAS domain S-box-containing protein